MEFPSFSVLCTGHEMVEGHVEYVFHVTHTSGCTWKVQRRFSELLAANQGLSQEHKALPAFPPRGIPGKGFFLGQQLILQRVKGLQQYFQEVVARKDLSSTPAVQVLLGVQPPETVERVRVQRWKELPETQEGGTTWVELEVALPVLAPGFSGPAERIEVVVQPLGIEATNQIPTPEVSSSRAAFPLKLDGLPCGEEVALEVRAANCVGTSDAVVVRLRVPGKRAKPLDIGMRVRAVWAGDGGRYDAVVHSVLDGGSLVVVNWLRPAPLSQEVMHCVCEAGGNGGDDTTHRTVARSQVELVEEEETSPTIIQV
eukprot:gnl/MRDRNA2_/MRDRNA2_125708_c0_seq1.p1 gnl/MRDRNA2_/MRDRNA2_125708_c0~~gnl/MRDRNA2_/MRDRNA2_125708_c0_seq1.p1  ORF type:complete len:313 (-),score=52.94 gnl/MRDRNA2_/MRDRNA2_125708_c0_seq1:72-1010(-)